MTDKWVSMNDKVNKKTKKKVLKPFQVNKKLMKKANSNAIFMHCLPVGRGEEVTDEVIDGKVCNVPVRNDLFFGPYRTNFFISVITNCNHVININIIF